VRLRDPLPVQSASFASGRGRPNRWIIPAALALAAVILLIMFAVVACLGG
jgi:hypothetical protein